MAVIIGNGGVGEWLKPAVLKTVRPERVSGVRIPPPPPLLKSHQRSTPLFQFQAISEPENILVSNFISAVVRQLSRKRSELPISKVPSRIELNPLN